LTSEPVPLVIVEQTQHEPYWVAAGSPRDIAHEVHVASVTHLRAERQANAMAYFAVLAAAAAVVAAIPTIVDVRTAVAVPASGRYHLVDLFTNNIGAVIAAAAALIAGTLVRTRLDRFGVGLAGGAGLALAAFVGFQYGRTQVIESVAASDVPGGAAGHYELGFWVLVAAGVLGIATASIALAPIGGGARRRRTDLVIALVGVAGALALAGGPLLPVGGAAFTDNWSTDVAPTAFVVSRLVVLGVLAVTGVVGFASRRLWGVGIALGGMCVAGWQWLSSFAQLGDAPAGVGGRNPIAADSVPHVVTTTGFVAALLAVIAALIRSRPHVH
jgi:hypothetical protein